MYGLPEPECVRTAEAALLDRIALTLRVSVDSFYDRGDGPATSRDQIADLVAAFVAIEDPRARLTCLAFVRAASVRVSNDEEVDGPVPAIETA